MKKQFQSKSVPRGIRTIWRYLGALFILFTFAIGNVWAANVPAAAGTYSVVGKKPGNANRFYKLGNGVYIHRINNSSWDSSMGMKIPSDNQNGVAVYLSSSMKVSALINKKSDKNAVNVELKAYPITNGSTTFDAFEAGSDNSTEITVTRSSTASYTLSTSFAKLDSKKAENKSTNEVTFAAGYYYIVGTDDLGTTYLTSITLTAASSGPVDPTINTTAGAYTVGETALDLTTCVSSNNTTGAFSFAVKTDGGTSASISGSNFSATAAGTCVVTATQAAVSGTWNEKSVDFNVVVTASSGGGEDPEPTCPTSGVVYSLQIKNTVTNRSLAKNTGYDLTSDDVTIVGGSTASIKNIDASNDGKMRINSKKFDFQGNAAYLKIVLDCPLQAGDLIEIQGGTGKQIAMTPTEGTPANGSPKINTSSYKYTITAADVTANFAGEGILTYYLGRKESGGTQMTGITITRPYAITFSSAKGSTPSATTGFEIALTQITGVEGWVHTGWTANKVVKVGGSDVAIGTAMAVDATAAVSDDTQFTAVWTEDIPAVNPTITFNNGAYTIGGTALDLSTLFSSNSTGAVTYTVKTDGGTSAAIDGTSFTASAAGTAVVTASQAAAVGYNAATADANIVVSAPAEVDGIKMVVDGDLTGNFRTSQTLTTLSGDNKYTIAGLNYTKYIKFGSSVSSWSAVAGPSNKYLVYTPTKKTTNFYFYIHNNSSSASYINLYLIEEGNATPTKVQVPVAGSENALKTYELNITKNTEVYITAESNNVYYCQVIAVESGDALLLAPAVGYVMNLNKGRLSTASNTETTLEGLTFKLSSGYSIASGSNISIGTKGTHYVSFTIPETQTRQLQLTTSNTAKYTVSKTKGDDANQITPVANEAKNFNLTAGTWFINPQGSNVNITNIAFAATPDALTVEFDSKGGSDVASQALFVGDKVTEPSPAPTKDGHRLLKWQKGGADYDFDTELVAGDAPGFTLDAVWQKTWKVTFDADNGSDPVVVTVDNNQAVAQPANPEKSGFDFVEWQLSGSAYDFATLVTGDIALTATWEVAQTDASLSALSYNDNAIDVNSAENVSGVQTYTYHLPWGSTIDPGLVSVTKNAQTATVSSLVYDNENKRISFAVESGNHTVTINYAIQFVIDAKRGTSIVKATTNNVVTGLIGGTIDQSYSGNANSRKLNKGNYFGVTLANDETFQEGDVFIVNITTAADLGKFMVFADKDRTELIADQGIVYTKPNVASPVVCPTGEMMLVLPAAANGKKSLYLSRENVDNSEQWNVTFSYIEVTREMNPAIKSFKFGDDAATINESAKTISIDVPYGTAVTALTPTVEAYGNNGATYTPAGAKDFTSPVVYTVTDAYNEFHTDYTVTVNIAAPSTNAYLASLSVAGYALDFDKEEETYNIVLDYGTTVLPEITYAVEDAGLATAVKVEGGVNGETTITVTPQAGAGYEKVYTINFSVNTTPTFKVFDGRTMNAAIVSFTDPTSGMTWTSEDAATSSSGNTKTINGKTYTKSVKIFGSATNAGRYLKFTVPADYVAKFYLAGSTNSSTGEATLFFSKELTADPAKAIAGLTASVDDPKWAQTDYQLPGDYYFCVTGSARIYELSVTLYPIDEERAMTQGRFGTICYPNGGYLVGAMLLEIAYFDPDQKKIFFDEVIGGQMVAGAPYLFLPNEGVDKFAIVYTDNVNASAGHHNGLYGSYTQEALPTDGNHYIMLNNQYCKVVEANTYVGANRAYIQLDKIGNDYVAPAYGRRRVSLGVQQAEVATGLEDLNVGDQPIKIMINGQMYILRGEKMYDATGRLVK